jgi:hypothetical protein
VTITDPAYRDHVVDRGDWLRDHCTCRTRPDGTRFFTCLTNMRGGQCRDDRDAGHVLLEAALGLRPARLGRVPDAHDARGPVQLRRARLQRRPASTRTRSRGSRKRRPTRPRSGSGGRAGATPTSAWPRARSAAWSSSTSTAPTGEETLEELETRARRAAGHGARHHRRRRPALPVRPPRRADPQHRRQEAGPGPRRARRRRLHRRAAAVHKSGQRYEWLDESRPPADARLAPREAA